MSESHTGAATAAISIHILSLQKHWHGLARCAPHNPCLAITASVPVCWLLVWPYTTGPLSLLQISNTVPGMWWWPPYPHSLTWQKRTHSHIERANPLTVERAWQRRSPAHRPPWCTRSIVLAVTTGDIFTTFALG